MSVQSWKSKPSAWGEVTKSNEKHYMGVCKNNVCQTCPDAMEFGAMTAPTAKNSYSGVVCTTYTPPLPPDGCWGENLDGFASKGKSKKKDCSKLGQKKCKNGCKWMKGKCKPEKSVEMEVASAIIEFEPTSFKLFIHALGGFIFGALVMFAWMNYGNRKI